MKQEGKPSAKKLTYPSSQVQKFGLIGTSCAGKTSKAYEVLAALKRAGVHADGVLQQDRRFSFERALLETDPVAQWSFIANQVKAEADMMLRPGTEVLICDRTPLDFYAYYEWQYGRNDALYNFALDWCKRTYSNIYFLRALPYVDDGARLDEGERDQADVFIKLVIARAISQGLQVTEVVDAQETPEVSDWVRRLDVCDDILKSVRRSLSPSDLCLLPKITGLPSVLVGGSYAFNRQTKWSDLDVYLLSPEPMETGHSDLKKYETLIRDVFGIDVEVRGVVPEVYAYLRDTQGFKEFKTNGGQ